MLGAGARPVDILDPEQEAPARAARAIMREDRRKGVAEMQPPVGLGAKRVTIRLSFSRGLDRDSCVVLSMTPSCHVAQMRRQGLGQERACSSEKEGAHVPSRSDPASRWLSRARAERRLYAAQLLPAVSLWPWQTAIKAVFLDRVDIVANYEREVRSPTRR